MSSQDFSPVPSRLGAYIDPVPHGSPHALQPRQGHLSPHQPVPLTPVQELWQGKVRGWCYLVSILSVQLSG